MVSRNEIGVRQVTCEVSLTKVVAHGGSNASASVTDSCVWIVLLACTKNLKCHSAYPCFKYRVALEPRQNAYISSNSYLAERSCIACLARFSDRVEES